MRKGLLATILFGLILVLAACGGNDDSGTEDTGGNDATEQEQAGDNGTAEDTTNNDLDITATNFEFDEEAYTVQAGEEVKIALTNEDGMHGLAIDDFDVNIEGDGEATFTPDEPGEYTIYCSIPCGQGHDDMTSTLVVK